MIKKGSLVECIASSWITADDLAGDGPKLGSRWVVEEVGSAIGVEGPALRLRGWTKKPDGFQIVGFRIVEPNIEAMHHALLKELA